MRIYKFAIAETLLIWMLFWRGVPEEEVKMSELEKLLDALFDKKLEKFAARTSRASGEITRVKQEFMLACDEFEKLSVEPDTDYVRLWNPGYIRNQKLVYVAAIRRILGRDAVASGSTAYARSSSMLTDLDSLIEEIQKINEAFKPIVHAYHGHLGKFKNASVGLGAIATGLRYEIEKAGREADEYNSVKGCIFKLRALADEVDAAEEGLAALQGKQFSKKNRKEEIKDAESRLSTKLEGLNAIKMEIGETASAIDSVLVPLEKAARIYDHFSGRKRKLSEIVTNPLQALGSGAGLAELNTMLDELDSSIKAGRLEIKNPDTVVAHISNAKNANLHDKISRLELLHSEEQTMKDEIRHLERLVEELNTEISTSEAHEKESVEQERRITELRSSLQEEKEVVEGLFVKYYKKKIAIK